MQISDFKIIKNRQNPGLCYQYDFREEGYKFQITTFNSGKSYLITIEKRVTNEWRQIFSENGVTDLQECIDIIEQRKADIKLML